MYAIVVLHAADQSTAPLQPGAVPRAQVLDQEIVAFAEDHEMAARKPIIIDPHVGGGATSHSKRFIAELPSLGYRTVILKQAK
jgi:hypothetical protein